MRPRGRCAGAWPAARNSCVSARRCKNEVHAVLMRNLKGRPPMPDAFGKRGRTWLAELELPEDERQTVGGCLRQVDFLDAEIAILERAVADHALASPDIRRLMTVPGVSLMTAATFIAAVSDIQRFGNPRRLVSYLGLDPRSASQASRLHATGGSPSRAPPRCVRC
jgi:transposase